MGIEWQMIEANIGDDEAINEALQENWEPFAVYRGRFYFKRQSHSEANEPRSSTKPENFNWAGTETTP